MESRGEERRGEERKGEERQGMERKGKERKGKERKDYAFWRQLNEKPSILPGCPGINQTVTVQHQRPLLTRCNPVGLSVMCNSTQAVGVPGLCTCTMTSR
jgi:hypothetical protein